MTFYNCSFCENSFRSNEEWQEHEKVCVKNGKTDQERFEARKRLFERKKNKTELTNEPKHETEWKNEEKHETGWKNEENTKNNQDLVQG